MTFDPKVYHDTHATLNNYISSPTALSSTMWQHSSIGLELVNEISELPAKLIIVGWISPYRLKCGPAGNHIVNGMSPLEKAKYQFHITRPAHSDLAANYEAGIANLEMLQGQVATTDQRMSMIVNDVTGKMIHFVRNIFFLRVCAILCEYLGDFKINRRMPYLTLLMEKLSNMHHRWMMKQHTGQSWMNLCCISMA